MKGGLRPQDFKPVLWGKTEFKIDAKATMDSDHEFEARSAGSTPDSTQAMVKVSVFK